MVGSSGKPGASDVKKTEPLLSTITMGGVVDMMIIEESNTPHQQKSSIVLWILK